MEHSKKQSHLKAAQPNETAVSQKSNKASFPFPTLNEEGFPGVEHILQHIRAPSISPFNRTIIRGDWALFLSGDNINLTPQWLQVQTFGEDVIYCMSVWILSSMVSNTGNISSFSNAIKTFAPTCFVFVSCSLTNLPDSREALCSWSNPWTIHGELIGPDPCDSILSWQRDV